MEIKKYGRYWALYDRGYLVALVLYARDPKKQFKGRICMPPLFYF